MEPDPNASLAIEMPNGEVLLSVFIVRTRPHQVAPVLARDYGTYDKAVSLVVRGDRECLVSPAPKGLCRYFCETSEVDAIDCLPELFENYPEYESAIVGCSYGFNYVFKTDQWYRLESVESKPVYTPVSHYLKEPNGQSNKNKK